MAEALKPGDRVQWQSTTLRGTPGRIREGVVFCVDSDSGEHPGMVEVDTQTGCSLVRLDRLTILPPWRPRHVRAWLMLAVASAALMVARPFNAAYGWAGRWLDRERWWFNRG